MIAIIKQIVKDRTSIIIGAAAGLFFLVMYHISIDYLHLTGRAQFSFNVLAGGWDLALRQRAPYLWESLAILNFHRIQFFISPLNLLLGLLLAILILFNIAAAVFSYRYKRSCNLKIRQSLSGVLPALLTGFACCAPAFLIALSPILPAFFTIYFIQLQRFLIPASFILMVTGLYRNLHKLAVQFPDPESLPG